MNVSNIKLGATIIVNSAKHSVLAKVFYISIKTNRKYWKIFLSSDCVLGYDFPNTSMPAYFGKLIQPLPYDYDSLPDKIIFDGKVYKKDGPDDYERVLNFEFGDLKDAEGECRFINYSADDGSWISPGLISETGTRADVYGEDISKYEIKFVE
ncbi:MAG: hypothetical protein FWE50_04210 [Alphaproteobacteria bacterium]|nr:hypothetical protein [Alphaproteobacteria bacterium]